MKIYAGSDHAGVKLKAALADHLRRQHDVTDVGAHDEGPSDYPDWAATVARAVQAEPTARGLLVCGSGIGVSIAANKVRGVRAVDAWNVESARVSRSHNDTNVLCLGARFLAEPDARTILDVWLDTAFEGGRHLQRVKKIGALEGGGDDPAGRSGGGESGADRLVLAGDIGGTNSRLSLYRGAGPVFEKTFPSADHPSLEAVVEKFLDEARKVLGPDARPDRACLGIAGPVENDTVRTTNLPWFVDARRLEQKLRIPRVALINDFQAAALGATLLSGDDLLQLGGGARVPNGPIAVAGAGTGLGEAFLLWSPAERRYQVAPSEGGHVDFTPRSGLETGLYTYLAGRYGRVSCERVLSGAGIADIFGFLTNEPSCRPLVSDETRAALVSEDPAAVITRQALAGRDPVCVIAINLFTSILGGLAGNLALTFLTTGGVFIAGGIAPRIASILGSGIFREAFEAKGRFQPLLARIPAFLVLHKDLGLLGAVEQARRM